MSQDLVHTRAQSRCRPLPRLSFLKQIMFDDSRPDLDSDVDFRSQSRSHSSFLARCWSRSLILEVVTNRESIAPEVVRACRYYVHTYEDSTHMRLLVVQVLSIMAAYCLLSFMISLHVCCELFCCACASACAVQVQVQISVLISYVEHLPVLVTYDVSQGSQVLWIRY